MTRKFLRLSLSSLMSLVPSARPIPMIGPIRGEMSIAPIMTAVELMFSPTEAMITEKARIHTLGPLNQMLVLMWREAISVSIWSPMFTTPLNQSRN